MLAAIKFKFLKAHKTQIKIHTKKSEKHEETVVFALLQKLIKKNLMSYYDIWTTLERNIMDITEKLHDSLPMSFPYKLL